MITDERSRAIWKQLYEASRTDELKEGELTLTMLQESLGATVDQANRFIRKMLKQGKISKRRVMNNGKSSIAYSIVDDTEQPTEQQQHLDTSSS